MEITEIKIIPVNNGDGVLAYVSVVFDDCFAVKHIRLIDTAKGIIISMPSRRKKFYTSEKYSHEDLAYPINEKFRLYLNNEILKKYEQERRKEQP